MRSSSNAGSALHRFDMAIPAENGKDLPQIDADEGDLRKVSAEALEALKPWNTPPTLFLYGNEPARIQKGVDHTPSLRTLTPDRLRHVLARAANWMTFKYAEPKKIPPPMVVIKDLLASPILPFPKLTRIVEVPVFAADGTLQLEPGYHASTGIYYAPAPGFEIPSISDIPSEEEIVRAKALILDDLLHDFPLVGPAEKAHVVALMIEPVVRNLILGPTPLYLISATCPGTGKGLLAETAAYPVLGRWVPVMTEAAEDEEWRKRITACLRSGPQYILIDNLKRPLESGHLAGVITTGVWGDRLLGRSENLTLHVTCTWMATGNNPRLSLEIIRRTIRIRMIAKEENPWTRDPKTFKHPRLREWVEVHRSDLVWAMLTLVKAWLSAGRPQGTHATLGSFESWSEVMGGILSHAGIKGFLENLEDFYEQDNSEDGAFQSFVDAWWQKHQDKPVGVAELFEICQGPNNPLDLGEEGDRSQRTKLGRLMVGLRDRQFGSYRITGAQKYQGAQRWKLVKVEPPR